MSKPNWKDELSHIYYHESFTHAECLKKTIEYVGSLLEAEKKKAEARGFNTLLATSGCYSFEQTKQLIEAEKKKAVLEAITRIEAMVQDGCFLEDLIDEIRSKV